MTYTLAQLTYYVAREIGGGILFEGVATNGSATTIVDTNDRLEADNYWQGGTAWVLEADGAAPEWENSVIASNTQSTKTITLRSTLGAAVGAGDRYAVAKKRFPLHILTQMVNSAILDLGGVAHENTTLVIADDQREYQLPSADIGRDLRQVWIQDRTDDSNDNQWREIQNWELMRKGVAGTADYLKLRQQYEAGRKLRLIYIKPHANLFLSTDVLNQTIPLERITFDAAARCIRWYKDKTRLKDFDNTLAMLERKVEMWKMEAHISYPRPPANTLMRY